MKDWNTNLQNPKCFAHCLPADLDLKMIQRVLFIVSQSVSREKKIIFTFAYGQQRMSVKVSGCESRLKCTLPFPLFKNKRNI